MRREDQRRQVYRDREVQVRHVRQPKFQVDPPEGVPLQQVPEEVRLPVLLPVLLIIPVGFMIHEPENRLKIVVLVVAQVVAQIQHVREVLLIIEAALLLQHVAAGTLTNVLRQAPVEVAVIREHTRRLHEVVQQQEVPLQVAPHTQLQAEVLPVLLQVAEVHLREVPDRQAADLRVAEAVVAAADKYSNIIMSDDYLIDICDT